MFHLSPRTGEVAPCGAASPDSCPYGSDEHFSSRGAAEASLSERFGGGLSGRSKANSTAAWEAAAVELRRQGDTQQARAEWLEASIQYALTPEGRARFDSLVEASAPTSSRRAFAESVIHQANLRRVNVTPMDDLLSIVTESDSTAPAPEARRATLRGLREAIMGNRPALESPFRWEDFPERTLWPSSRVTSDYVKYQRAADDFLQDETSATAQDLNGVLSAISIHSDLWIQMPPLVPQKDWSGNATYSMDPEEWREKAEESRKYSKELAKRVLVHPEANSSHRDSIAKMHGRDFVADHAVMDPKEREEFLLQEFNTSAPMSDSVLKMARDDRFQSNRVALLLAAKDPDSFHRQEAFHQVTMAGMETFTEQDRAWMARNLGHLPASEGTVDTLKKSLIAWAKGHADQAERDSLLSLLEEPEKRRWFSRD